MAVYTCLVARTTTGEVVDELPMSDFTWSDSLDLSRAGSMTITTPLLSDGLTSDASNRVRARSVAGSHWYWTLILMRDAQPLFAGPVVTHDVAADRSTVQFGCTSIATLLDARMVLKAGTELTPATTDSNLILEVDQYSIACTLLALATTGTGRALPFTLPSPSIVIDVLRNYTGADLASVLERLTQLSQEKGGPDIRFRATLDLNQRQLGWTVDVGNPRLGLVSSPWAWDFPTTITQIAETGDSSEMTFRGYVTGDAAGSSEIPPIGVAEDLTFTAQGWPMLERSTRMADSVHELPVLTSHAQSFVATNRLPALTWTIEVDPEAFPEIGTWSLGDNATFNVSGDSWVLDGTYPQRLIGVTHTPTSASLETSSVLVSP